MKAHVSFVAALLAVLMLGIGACCCGGAILAADVKASKHECCAEKSAPPAHKNDCHCSGQVLIDAKQSVSFIPAPLPALSYAAPGMCGSPHAANPPRCVSARVASAMERPPPHEIRRWLGIWLV